MSCKAGAELRAATAADLPGLSAIEAGEGGNGRWGHAQFLAELGLAWSRVWVLEGSCGGDDAPPHLLGFMVFWHVADELQLHNIAVAPRWRRQGLGKRLLAALEEHARACKVARIVLEVRRDNHAAQHLYTERGFVQVGIRPRYYPDTGEDAILMEQHI